MERQELLRQMISEYRRKIETYEAMILEWEAELGGSPRTVTEKVGQDLKSKTGSPATGVAAMVRDWQFYGKSQPDGAKALLELVGHPLKTDQIIEGIEKGGVKLGGKTAKDKKTNLYTILHRSPGFVLIAKDTWALPGWPGVHDKEKKANDGENDKKEK